MWFNMFGATKGSVRGMQTRSDGLARNSETEYQSFFRHGSHQSGTRAWLRPTLMTETLVRKPYFGHVVGKGFEADVHCVIGAPKESMIKIAQAEGGSPWLPVREGLRPTYESDLMKRYLRGGFVTKL
jgi:nitrate reductase / nitrite oxidoreductase, alpha subunit